MSAQVAANYIDRKKYSLTFVGCKPITTLESARRFRTLNPTMPVMGVEIDKEWVRLAQTYQNEITHFRKGGFNLPVKGKEKVFPISTALVAQP